MRLKLLSLLFGSALAVVAGIAGLLTLHAEASGEAAGVWRGAGHIIAGHKLKWVTQTSTADVEFWFALDGSGNAVGYGLVRYGLFLDDSRLRGLLACGERNRQLSTRACPRHRFSSRHEQRSRVQMAGSPAGTAPRPSDFAR